MALSKGCTFSSFAEFEETLKSFQRTNNIVFCTKASKKLSFHPHAGRLIYQFAHYACKQGPKRTSESKGIRPNQRTLKCDCPAYVRIAAVEDGTSWVLKITGSNHEHLNHPVNALTAAVYPENRKAELTDTVRALASMEVPTKTLKAYIEDSQGICLLPQDVSNLKRKVCGVKGSDNENVEQLLSEIREEGGFTKVGVNDSGEFEFLFYVTAKMKRDLERFSDILVMDATYKVNQYLYPLVNVLCIDAEGSGRPVLHGFVRSECRESMLSCLNFLKSVLPEEISPSVFFVDKDFSEISAIRGTFSDSCVKLCSFHASSAVKKALVNDGLSPDQVDDIMTFFREQRDTASPERFQELCCLIRDRSSEKIIRYFEEKWWKISDMWATHTTLDLQTLHLTTTNHVESYHSKVKKTIDSHIRLSDCVRALLTYDADLVKTKDLKSHLHSITHHYNAKHKDSGLEKIINRLTRFGGKIITEQYNLAKKITYTYIQQPCSSTTPTQFQIFHVTGETQQKNSYSTTMTSCNCDFYRRFHLSCRHIFSLRLFLRQPLYDPGMFSDSRFLALRPSEFDCDTLDVTSDPIQRQQTDIVPSRRVTKTQEGRYRIVSAVTSRINSVFQVMGESQFNQRIEQLESFLELVTSDKDFALVDMTLDRDSPHQVIDDATEVTASLTNQVTDDATEVTSSLTNQVTDDATEVTASLTNQVTDDATEVTASLTNQVTDDATEVTASLTNLGNSMPGNTDGEALTVVETETLIMNTEDTETLTSGADIEDSNSSSSNFANIKLHKVKTRGRPRNVQNFTRRKKRKIDQATVSSEGNGANTVVGSESTSVPKRPRTITIIDLPCNRQNVNKGLSNEQSLSVSLKVVERSLCRKCGVEVVRLNTLKNWVKCDNCPAVFHRSCLPSDVRIKGFICQSCLPVVINSMQNMLADYEHNVVAMH